MPSKQFPRPVQLRVLQGRWTKVSGKLGIQADSQSQRQMMVNQSENIYPVVHACFYVLCHTGTVEYMAALGLNRILRNIVTKATNSGFLYLARDINIAPAFQYKVRLPEAM